MRMVIWSIYGYQWRFWEKHTEEDGTTKKEHVDQLANLIDSLKNNPDSRRHIVSAWNVAIWIAWHCRHATPFPMLCLQWSLGFAVVPALSGCCRWGSI